jgi:NIMA (never in mitosis gene a)-related kinase
MLIGSGAFGKIFPVKTPPGEMRLCMKKIDLTKPGLTPEGAEKEAENWQLLSHRNIVKLVGWHFDDKYFNIIMELVDGITLTNFLDKYRKNNQMIDESLIFSFLNQIISALKYCHKQRIIHRDLKPDNIIITSDEHIIKIIDFGVSRLLSSDLSMAASYAGTPLYMAPELVKNEKYSFPADVWSTGVILYELITLQYPFDKSSLYTLTNSIVNGNVPVIHRNCDSKLTKAVSLML